MRQETGFSFCLSVVSAMHEVIMLFDPILTLMFVF